MKCARTACNNEASVKIYNDPCTELGYREYCQKCAMKIISYSMELDLDPLKYDGLSLVRRQEQEK